MLQCRLVTLTTWSEKPTRERKKGRFQIDHTQLLNELSAELTNLDATDIVLQMDLPESKIRRAGRSFDGWPKADTKPTTPGIILSFDRAQGPLSFACDTYDDFSGGIIGWQDNLRAISLTLTNLRAIDRYGATKRGQQYRGYAALPPPSDAPLTENTIRPVDAALLLSLSCGYDRDTILALPEDFQKAYREAAMKVHPDRGGNSEKMAAVNQAAEVLKAYHRL